MHLSVFANVHTALANNPCDRIAGIPYIDSALGWLTAIGFWFALPCLFYTLLNALVPSNKREGDLVQSMYSIVANNQPTIDSQSQLSSKYISGSRLTASVSVATVPYKLVTFLSFYFTKAIDLLEDTMGWVLKNYLVNLEAMGSEELRIVEVETSSEVPTFEGKNMLSKGRDPYWENNVGTGLPWFKVLMT